MESIFRYFLLLLLAASCAGQGVDIKDKPSPISQATEIQRGEEAKPVQPGMPGKDCVPGEILIKFKDGTDRQAIETITNKLHLKSIRVLSSQNFYLMKITDGSSVEKVMKSLRKHEEVKFSEPNYVRTVR